MGSDALLFSLLTLILLLSAVAGYALGALKRGSASTRPTKQPPLPPPTPPSDTALAQVMADQAELFSTLGKLTTTVKRLSSRQGMQDVRARREAEDSNSAPPVGTSKADLLRYYGMSGKVGPAFAQAQRELELRQANNERSN